MDAEIVWILDQHKTQSSGTAERIGYVSRCAGRKPIRSGRYKLMRVLVARKAQHPLLKDFQPVLVVDALLLRIGQDIIPGEDPLVDAPGCRRSFTEPLPQLSQNKSEKPTYQIDPRSLQLYFDELHSIAKFPIKRALNFACGKL